MVFTGCDVSRLRKEDALNKIYAAVAIVVSLVIAFFTSGGLILACGVAFWLGAGAYVLIREGIRRWRLSSPEAQEQLERAWWLSERELPAPSSEIDWEEFEDAVELRLLQADDVWAPIDTADMIYRAERDMAFVWPPGAEWACPNCTHRFNRPMDQCPLCDYWTKEDERVPAPGGAQISNDLAHKGWRCPECKKLVPVTMHSCNHCGEGFRGGGPYSQEVFDGPDGPVLETIYEDPRTGAKAILSSRKMQPDEYETCVVAEGGTEIVVPTTSRHNWAGGTDFSSGALGLFQIPPHMIGSSEPDQFHISASTRSRAEERRRRLWQEMMKSVQSHQMTYEQAQDAIQRLMRDG
jgi:hypothetical protein